ncbi:hypothetical protein [Pseudomonas syringae]|uniref:hypothetical protein n=1 Tax=Pseudomonas syringae TaxID=317 RepID=UPI0032D98060
MIPEWIGRGKTVAQLIEELRSFEDQSLEVRISIDGGESSQLISLVTKRGGYAVLENHQDEPTTVRHVD